MKIDDKLLRKIIEGALLAADGPLSISKISSLFEVPEGSVPNVDLDPDEKPTKEAILTALEDIQADCKDRGYELKEVGTGWRFQVVQETAPWIGRLWEEKPQKYSRALLETLALIAYRQPITRGDIESIRGVAVSSTIIKTLTEREWVKVVGHRDVPGRPALYATTRQFLDYFNLKSLDELPSLKEIQDFDQLDTDLSLKEMLGNTGGADESAAAGNEGDHTEAGIEQAQPEESSGAQMAEEATVIDDGDSDSDSADTEFTQEPPPEDSGSDNVEEEADAADQQNPNAAGSEGEESAVDAGTENAGAEWNKESKAAEDFER